MYRLVIEDDEGRTTLVPLIRDEFSIGRREGNSIRLTQRNVSRRHARVFRENNGFFVEDLGSYNGVRLNGERIAGRRTLREGDIVQIGDYHLMIQRVVGQKPANDVPTEAPAPVNAVQTLPAGYDCVSSRGLGESQRAMLHYFGGIVTFREEAPERRRTCDLLLAQGERSEPPEIPPGWHQVWEGTRPGENDEYFWLYGYGPPQPLR